MALLEVVFGKKIKAKIGLVTLDASVEETHIKSNEVTSHPVEVGSDISDHIRQTPDKIEIKGVISDTPIYFLASLSAPSPVEGDVSPVSERAKRADQEFIRAMDAGEIVDVITSLRSYSSMVISEYSVTRDKDSGNILSFSISLQKIVIVSPQEVSTPFPKNPSSSGVRNLGKKATDQADPGTEENVSALMRASNFITGFISP